MHELTYASSEPSAKSLAAEGMPLLHDALMCVSDPVAFGARMSLQRLGLKIPQVIAVTGIGAFEISTACSPTMTTVDVGAQEIGRLAGRVIAQILGGQASDTKHIITGVTPQIGSWCFKLDNLHNTDYTVYLLCYM